MPRDFGGRDEDARADDPAHDQHRRVEQPKAAHKAVRAGLGALFGQIWRPLVMARCLRLERGGNKRDDAVRSSKRRHARGCRVRDLVSFGFPCSEAPRASSAREWCPGTGSNRRHRDFQSRALPTELPGLRHSGRAAAKATRSLAVAPITVHPVRPRPRARESDNLRRATSTGRDPCTRASRKARGLRRWASRRTGKAWNSAVFGIPARHGQIGLGAQGDRAADLACQRLDPAGPVSMTAMTAGCATSRFAPCSKPARRSNARASKLCPVLSQLDERRVASGPDDLKEAEAVDAVRSKGLGSHSSIAPPTAPGSPFRPPSASRSRSIRRCRAGGEPLRFPRRRGTRARRASTSRRRRSASSPGSGNAKLAAIERDDPAARLLDEFVPAGVVQFVARGREGDRPALERLRGLRGPRADPASGCFQGSVPGNSFTRDFNRQCRAIADSGRAIGQQIILAARGRDESLGPQTSSVWQRAMFLRGRCRRRALRASMISPVRTRAARVSPIPRSISHSGNWISSRFQQGRVSASGRPTTFE